MDTNNNLPSISYITNNNPNKIHQMSHSCICINCINCNNSYVNYHNGMLVLDQKYREQEKKKTKVPGNDVRN